MCCVVYILLSLCVCSASNDRVSLIFDDKSKEIDNSPTIVDTLTRSPADPSMVCVCDSVMVYYVITSGSTTVSRL